MPRAILPHGHQRDPHSLRCSFLRKSARKSIGCVSFQLALLPWGTVNGFRERIERIPARIGEEKPRRMGDHPFNLFQESVDSMPFQEVPTHLKRTQTNLTGLGWLSIISFRARRKR
jgi:hypothetical protein